MQQISTKRVKLELCKKFKFDHTNNLESVLENKIHKILWDFEIQMDYLIVALWLFKSKKHVEKTTAKHSCRVVVHAYYDTLFSEDRCSSLGLVCRTKFIAWWQRCPIGRMPTGSKLFTPASLGSCMTIMSYSDTVGPQINRVHDRAFGLTIWHSYWKGRPASAFVAGRSFFQLRWEGF